VLDDRKPLPSATAEWRQLVLGYHQQDARVGIAHTDSDPDAQTDSYADREADRNPYGQANGESDDSANDYTDVSSHSDPHCHRHGLRERIGVGE
jgi:hypothetical protein